MSRVGAGSRRTAGAIRADRIEWKQRRRARRVVVEHERFVRGWKRSINNRWTRGGRCRAGLGCERGIVRIFVLLVAVRAHRWHALQRFLGDAHLIVEHLKERFRCRVASMEVPKDADLNEEQTLAYHHRRRQSTGSYLNFGVSAFE